MSDETTGARQGFAAELRQRPILIAAALVLGVLVVYGAVSQHAFLRWDDNLYVTENARVSNGISATNVAWAFREIGIFYWHPVTWLSHMLDCQLFGLAPGPHHLVNVLLHAINVLLLFYLLCKATGAFWRSSLVAALFALHPINVETVAWIAERKSLLSALFSLLTIAAYGWYVRKRSWKRYAAVMLLFLMALMSKPMAVTLPLVLLLVDFWPLSRFSDSPGARELLKFALEKVPLLLMSAGSGILTIIGQRAANAISPQSAVPVGMRLEQATVSYFVYLRKLFWPTDLAPFYPYHPHWTSPIIVLVAVIALVVITIAAARLRQARYILTGWLAFVVTLLPVIGIVQVGRVVIADRFAYVSAIGVFIALIWGCGDLVEKYSINRAVPAIFSAAIVLGLAMAAYRDVQHWENGVKLFTHAATVQESPDAMLEDMIADALVAERQIDAALVHYRRSCELDPHFDLCHYNIAEILFSRYAIYEALEHYQLAGRYTTNRQLAVNCLVNSGEAFIDLGNLDAAERQLGYALTLDPGNPGANRLMAQVSARRGAH